MGVGMSNQCSYIKTDGSQCKAFAISNSNYCFFHVANGAAARFAGSRGGRKAVALARKKRLPPGPVNLRCIEDILSLLEGSINEVRKGQVESRVANSVGYLANILIKAIEQGELQRRVQALEQRGALYASLSADTPDNIDDP